jgi:hypothetical protein
VVVPVLVGDSPDVRTLVLSFDDNIVANIFMDRSAHCVQERVGRHEAKLTVDESFPISRLLPSSSLVLCSRLCPLRLEFQAKCFSQIRHGLSLTKTIAFALDLGFFVSQAVSITIRIVKDEVEPCVVFICDCLRVNLFPSEVQ